MVLHSEYNIDDCVFFMHENKICKGLISDIIFPEIKGEPISKVGSNNMIGYPQFVEKCKYRIRKKSRTTPDFYTRNKEGDKLILDEENIYPSRQKLIDNL